MEKIKLLINLPPGFFGNPALTEPFARLDALAETRKTSHNRADEIAPELRAPVAPVILLRGTATGQRADGSGTDQVDSSATTPATTIASRCPSAKKPAVAATAIAATSSRCRGLRAAAAAQPSARHHSTTGAE